MSNNVEITPNFHSPPGIDNFLLVWLQFKRNAAGEPTEIKVKYKRTVKAGQIGLSWIETETTLPIKFLPIAEYKPPAYWAAMDSDSNPPAEMERPFSKLESFAFQVAEKAYLGDTKGIETVEKITRLGGGDFSLIVFHRSRKSSPRLLVTSGTRRPGTKGVNIPETDSDEINEIWEKAKDHVYQILFAGLPVEVAEIEIEIEPNKI